VVMLRPARSQVAKFGVLANYPVTSPQRRSQGRVTVLLMIGIGAGSESVTVSGGFKLSLAEPD